jgi:hypothetical protein
MKPRNSSHRQTRALANASIDSAHPHRRHLPHSSEQCTKCVGPHGRVPNPGSVQASELLFRELLQLGIRVQPRPWLSRRRACRQRWKGGGRRARWDMSQSARWPARSFGGSLQGSSLVSSLDSLPRATCNFLSEWSQARVLELGL